MRGKGMISLLLALAFLLSGCGTGEAEPSPTGDGPRISASPAAEGTAAPDEPLEGPVADPREGQIGAMTDGELVGQLLVAGIMWRPVPVRR